MATTVAAKAPVEAPEATTPKKSKLLLIVIVALTLLAAAGAGAWYFMSQGDAEDDAEPRVSSKPAVFLPVDQFTVNLQPEDGPQFLQVTMTLKLADQTVVEAIKAQMPEVRSRVLLLLSSKKASQLSTAEGKIKLAEEIAHEVEAPLPQEKSKARSKANADAGDKPAKKAKGKAKAKAKAQEQAEENSRPPARVLAVFFTHFIVQ